jgi:hypothetical protein
MSGADLADALFEQVPGGAGQGLDEPRGERDVGVLGEQEHRYVWVGGADALGGLEPFVGEGGRHPQVEQHRVGWLLVNEPDQRQRVGGGIEQGPLVKQFVVVHQHGQRRATGGDLGGGTAGRQPGEIGGAPVGIHVRLGLGNSVTDRQTGITQRCSQRLPHACGAGRPAQRDHQVGDRGPGLPDAHQPDQQRDRYGEPDDGDHRALRGGLRRGQRREPEQGV